MSQPDRAAPPRLSDYPRVLPITTRWADMDIYGHVNNVVYYSYFDTVVNEHLIAHGVLDPETSPVIGVVVETRCVYFRSLMFPRRVLAGLKVEKLGSSSVRYNIGLFQEGDADAAAQGHFVHVYVDRVSRRPAAIPDAVRAVLAPLA